MDELDRSPVVLGPSEDGGYYLVGARFDAPLIRRLFRRTGWGTPTLLDETIRDLHGAGIRYSLLPRLLDIDTPEDLARWLRLTGRPFGAPPSGWEG